MFTPLAVTILLFTSIDLSVSQRKVSRNVQVGADIKTVNNFACPEEFGYYPHPSDCTQYYVCVYGGALLESCTGGLMYSHELQTCDWPRNVGCDGEELSSSVSATSSSPQPRQREESQPRQRYTPPTPPPAQPAAVVTSRGQPRQLHHNQQEIIKQRQQQQLYAEAEETLPPAEEVESDRQQRVYRGQPSTLGQVQKDRDGLRHSNAISSYSSRGERIGVISFGTQNQQSQQPKQQYSDNFDDNLVTNDLTLKRRRKRQTPRSRHRTRETTWRIGHPDLKSSRFTMPLSLQPPPVQTHSIYTHNYQQGNYAPSQQNNDKEFKPFIPQYKRLPTHTIANKEPYAPIQNTRYTVFSPSTTQSDSDNYSYFKIGSTLRPFTEIPSLSTTKQTDKKANSVNFYQDPSSILLQPQYTHVINHNVTSIKISNPNIKSGTSSTTSVPVYEENSEENKNSYESSSEEGHFGPPSSYFRSKSKYEDIENPFANPNFDFDQFLANLRGDRFITRPKAKVVPTKVENTHKKHPQEDYYYYDDDDDGDSGNESKYQTSSEAPKKIYSSQIKPSYSATKTPKPNTDDYYYEYEDEEPKNGHYDENKILNSSNHGEVKYSAKYQGKPAKISKNAKTATTPYYYNTQSTGRPSTSKVQSSETFVATITTTTTSTTQRPKYTARPRPKPTISSTRPSRSKQRQRLTDDDSTRLRVEQSSAAPASISTATATARTLYNSTQYNNNYDPYYAIYDDDVELYKDVDYAQHYNNNNNNNNAQQQSPQQTYRRTPAPAVQSTTQQVQEDQPQRGSYIQNKYNTQDIYQPSTVQDYNDDNSYNSQVDDQNSYRQINRQSSRGDRNDLNYIEEATTKRTTITTTTRKPTTTTRTTTTSTTTPRTIPPKKSTLLSRAVTTEKESKTHNTLRDDPGQYPLPSSSLNTSLGHDTKPSTVTYRPDIVIPNRDSINAAVVNKPAPFTLPEHLTTDKPIVYHYITKPSRSTSLVSSTEQPDQSPDQTLININNSTTVIVPTTYSPPKFFLKSLLPKYFSSTSPQSEPDTKPKTLKFVRKLISPLNVNYGLSSVTGASFESAEKLVSDVDVVNIKQIISTTRGTTSTTSTTEKLTTKTTTTTTLQPDLAIELNYDENFDVVDEPENVEVESRLRHYIQPNFTFESEAKRFRTTVEIPQPHDLYENDYRSKIEPDQSPEYKIKPNPKPISVLSTTTTTDSPLNTSIPARVSRVNNAIKSLIAFGGTRKQKCNDADAKCNDPKHQRTGTRGRGSAHYANAPNVANNEVTVTVNRGTPPSRSRPTLKPSTSIVSKASEFIDIYRFPPNRPDPIYPQPQPDKTAAKCRKDVCLLPDCSCGGKEIPGNLPVEEVPQIVLLTFDDAVNDLNKQYYIDIFENGRRNPNGCPITATFYVSHEWTDYSQVQNLYADGHEMASHTVSHSFGEQFSQKKWTREVAGQREILSAYGGVHLEDVRGMRAPFLSVGGNKMFKMLYDSNFTYDSSMPIYENKPPSWPYTLDYKLFHDCMIPPCPTRSYPGVWEVPMVMWQDLNGGRCSMGDACSNPPDAEGVFKMLTKNFQRHYTTNRAPFGLFYHAAWFTQPHHKEGFIQFLDSILAEKDVWLLTNWQAIQWIRDPTPTSRLGSFQPFQCDYSNRPKRCNNPKVCNLWHKSGVRYMRTCQPCPDIYPWTGNTGIRSSRIDNDIED